MTDIMTGFRGKSNLHFVAEEEQHEFLDIINPGQKLWRAASIPQDPETVMYRLIEKLKQEPRLVNAQPTGRDGGWRWSALHSAAYSGYVQLVDCIMTFGGDPLLLNTQGQTPLQVVEAVRKDLKNSDEGRPLNLDYIEEEVLKNPVWKERLQDDKQYQAVKDALTLNRIADTFFIVMASGDVIITDEARTLLLKAWMQTTASVTLEDVTRAINDEYANRREHFLKLTRCMRGIAEWVCWEFEVTEENVNKLLTCSFALDRKEYIWAVGPFNVGSFLAMLFPLGPGMDLACKHRVKRFADSKNKIKQFMQTQTFYLTLLGNFLSTRILSFLASFGTFYLICCFVWHCLVSPWATLLKSWWILLLLPLYFISKVLPAYQRAMRPRVPMLWIRLEIKTLAIIDGSPTASEGNGLKQSLLH